MVVLWLMVKCYPSTVKIANGCLAGYFVLVVFGALVFANRIVEAWIVVVIAGLLLPFVAWREIRPKRD